MAAPHESIVLDYARDTVDSPDACLDTQAAARRYLADLRNPMESKSSDRATPGGLSFIEPILTKTKSIIYRATCLRKAQAMPSSEKQEADTKKQGELSPKNNAVSFKVMEDNLSSWRMQQDFETLPEAKAYIAGIFGAATAGGG